MDELVSVDMLLLEYLPGIPVTPLHFVNNDFLWEYPLYDDFGVFLFLSDVGFRQAGPEYRAVKEAHRRSFVSLPFVEHAGHELAQDLGSTLFGEIAILGQEHGARAVLADFGSYGVCRGFD